MYLASASPTGHALIDRALYLLQSWTDDADRFAAAGILPGTAFATKPALATAMITAALDARTPASWVAATRSTAPTPPCTNLGGPRYRLLSWPSPATAAS